MNEEIFVIEGNKRGVILDPRTKLLTLLIITIVMMGGNITGVVFYIRIIIAMIPAILLLFSKEYKISIIYLLLISIASILEGIIIRQLSGNLNLICVVISGIISRFLTGFIMGYYLIKNTTVSEFIAGMERMHVTNKITIPLSVMFRYLPTIIEENKSISNVMKMRGIGFGGSTKNPLILLEYRLVPIMMSAVKIGDELSAASLTKGLGGNVKRTNMCKIGFHLADYILSFIVITCFIIYQFN